MVYESTEWHLDAFWRDGIGAHEADKDPYAGQTDQDDIPFNPPYWPSGVLSVQYALHQIFAEKVVELVVMGTMDMAYFKVYQWGVWPLFQSPIFTNYPLRFGLCLPFWDLLIESW